MQNYTFFLKRPNNKTTKKSLQANTACRLFISFKLSEIYFCPLSLLEIEVKRNVCTVVSCAEECILLGNSAYVLNRWVAVS